MSRSTLSPSDISKAKMMLAIRPRVSIRSINRATGVPRDTLRKMTGGHDVSQIRSITSYKPSGPLAKLISQLRKDEKLLGQSYDDLAPYLPSPAEIRLQTASIRRNWLPENRLERLTTLTTILAAFPVQTGGDLLLASDEDLDCPTETDMAVMLV